LVQKSSGDPVETTDIIFGGVYSSRISIYFIALSQAVTAADWALWERT